MLMQNTHIHCEPACNTHLNRNETVVILAFVDSENIAYSICNEDERTKFKWHVIPLLRNQSK